MHLTYSLGMGQAVIQQNYSEDKFLSFDLVTKFR